MRIVAGLVMLFTFGCTQLRYAPRTEMIEVAPDPLAVAAANGARPSSARRHADWHGLVIGGTVATLAGLALVIGGAFGVQNQREANATAAAQCMAGQGWFCGTFDDLSLVPYATLIAMGGMATIGGVALLATGVSARSGDDR